MRALILFVALAAACSSPAPKQPDPPVVIPDVTHGPAAFDVTHDSAIVWARANRAQAIEFELAAEKMIKKVGNATADSDFAVSVKFGDLEPDTKYTYAARAVSGGQDSVSHVGTFRTAPEPNKATVVRFAFSGDLGGQNVCRDAKRGYPIAEKIRAEGPLFFVALGDMIYADNLCEATGAFGNAQVKGEFGVATEIESFWAHWRYNRADSAFKALLAETSTIPVWDDHEVTNDFGPSQELKPAGLRAFLDYNPIASGDAPLYRSLRYGKNVELFVLDTRSFRSANEAKDDGPTPKTMLGAAQRDWLIAALGKSNATWKIIVSSVPISIPTGADPPNVARDGWADYNSGQGFERELELILDAAQKARINLLWITTDVHFASFFRYQLGADYAFHEAVVGPMSAGLYPKDDFDKTFKPTRLFFHGAKDPTALTYEEALSYMNFATVEVAENGTLSFEVIDGKGASRFTHELEPR